MVLSKQFLPLWPLLFLCTSSTFGQFEANWDSLDNRTIPDWYDKAKIGIFLHWGVYSVPSYLDAWFWYHWQGDNIPEYVDFMAKNYPPTWTYADFAPQFQAEFFDPSAWAALFKASGAKYVVLTAKHHEGFTLWPSKYSFNWNAQDVGPKRDLVGLIADAVRHEELTFGLYHSLLEFFHPFYLDDKAHNWTTTQMTDLKVMPEMKEMVERYQPEVIWSDGDWESPDTYWKATEFLAWLYNESPVKDSVVVNDRWGANDIRCVHGDFLTCNDRYNPGHAMPKKWENAMTIDKNSWAYRRDATFSDIMTIEELLATLAQTISYGGNLLINVGPSKEGTIIPIFQERLLQLGEWLAVNGEAVYETSPWDFAAQDNVTEEVYYTVKGGVVYAFCLEWPVNDELSLGAVVDLMNLNVGYQVEMLGYGDGGKVLRNEYSSDKVVVYFPLRDEIKKVKWAWVLKFSQKLL